jgi:hypothetical protein
VGGQREGETLSFMWMGATFVVQFWVGMGAGKQPSPTAPIILGPAFAGGPVQMSSHQRQVDHHTPPFLDRSGLALTIVIGMW